MYEYDAIITKVVDGDTLDAKVDLGFDISFDIRIRLADVDTPEIFRPKSLEEKELGLKAKAHVEELVLGKKVTILTRKDSKGKYGRYLATIFTKDGTNVSESLVRNNLLKENVEN
jgi:micrococcal nuclease